jgi:putative FmdB family regulatory protein
MWVRGFQYVSDTAGGSYMPIYEYQCRACGRRFELRQSFSDEPARLCPHCGVEDVRRLLSPPAGIFFKGPGFYSTDYKQSSRRSSSNGTSEEKETSSVTSDDSAAAPASTATTSSDDD